MISRGIARNSILWYENNIKKVIILAIAPSLLSIPILYLYISDQIAILAFFVTSGLVLSYFSVDISKNHSTLPSLPRKFSWSVFLFLLSASIISLAYRGFPVDRGLNFFLLISICYMIICYEIFSSELSDNIDVAGVLLGLIMTSQLYRSSFLQGIAYSTGDVTSHMLRLDQILSTGHAVDMLGYSGVPLYHIIWSTFTILFNINELTARHFMIILPSIGILLTYLLVNKLLNYVLVSISDKTILRMSLMSSLFFCSFTLLLRVKLQPEVLAFYILFPLSLSALLIGKRKANYILAFISGIALLSTHHYYGILLPFIIICGIPGALLYSHRGNHSAIRKFISISVALFTVWIYKVTFPSEFGILYAVTRISKLLRVIFTEGAVKNADLQPSFLSAESTIFQFLSVHLGEFVILSFSIVGFIYITQKLTRRSAFFVTSFFVFSVLTALGIVTEGQRNIADSISFRNAYLISIFLVIFAGIGIESVRTRFDGLHIIPILLIVLVLTTAFFSVTSIQANKLDPQQYTGDVQSPRAVTIEQLVTEKSMVNSIPEGSLIVSDTYSSHPYSSTTEWTPAGISHTPQDRTEFTHMWTRYDDPSLDILKSEYDYLIVNERNRDDGFVFGGTVTGLSHNRDLLTNEIQNNNKVWTGGNIKLYHKPEVTSGQTNNNI